MTFPLLKQKKQTKLPFSLVLFSSLTFYSLSLASAWSFFEISATIIVFLYPPMLYIQYLLCSNILQHRHLLNCNLVEFMQTLLLRHTFIDKDRI